MKYNWSLFIISIGLLLIVLYPLVNNLAFVILGILNIILGIYFLKR